MLDFTDSRWKPSVLSSFGDVLVQPFSVHRAGKGNSAPALGLDLGLLPFPGGNDPQQEVSQSPGIAVCLS